MADERTCFAATLCGDQRGKTVSGVDKYGEPFSGVVSSVIHLSDEDELSPAITSVKFTGSHTTVALTGLEVVTVS